MGVRVDISWRGGSRELLQGCQLDGCQREMGAFLQNNQQNGIITVDFLPYMGIVLTLGGGVGIRRGEGHVDHFKVASWMGAREKWVHFHKILQSLGPEFTEIRHLITCA